MPNLDEVLGALLSGLAHARQIADRETALIAERYRAEPLLEGMTVPRVRVPELQVELPVLIERFEPSQPGRPATVSAVARTIRQELDASDSEFGLALSTAQKRTIASEIVKGIKERIDRHGKKGLRPEHILSSVRENARTILARDDIRKKVPSTHRSKLVKRFHQSVLRLFDAERAPAALEISVLTAEIKEKADPANVTRLRLNLREEGLEWSSGEREDGTVFERLTPE